MYPPHAKLTRLADAAVEPLGLASAKNYLRVEHDADDALIADLITAARLVCEQLADRSFIATTWQLTLDYLPAGPGVFMSAYLGLIPPRMVCDDGSIVLPMPPLIEVLSIAYRGTSGLASTVDVSPESGAIVVTKGTPGRLAPGYGRFFPFTLPTIGAAEIVYTAGYGTAPEDVPRNVVQAIRMLVSHYYEHRSSQAEVPDAVMHLLGPSKWGGYA